MKSNNYKYEEDSSSLKLNSTIFQCADEVKLRIPTSCGRLGECHECIVEILNGDSNLSKRTEEEMFLKEPFRLACQAKIISKKEKLSFRPRNRDRKILTDSFLPKTFKPSNDFIISSSGVEKKMKDANIKLLDHESDIYGLAIDVGTTTVAINLVNLLTGEILLTSSYENPQIFGGSDVINRISYDSTKFRGELNKAIISSVNFEIGEMIKPLRIRRRQILEITIVGNTTMRDIFFDLNVETIGVKPYKSSIEFDYLNNKVNSTELKRSAKQMGIRINPKGLIYSPPLIASHIGSDVSAGLISSTFFDNDSNKLFIDIGTNTEVVIGNSKKMSAASCPAGPAFEGGEVTFGMPGYNGAIEKVKWDDEGINFQTIGNTDPLGICGSGLIDLLSEMKKKKYMNSLGQFKNQENELIVDKENNILISRKDVSALAQAKAANVCGQALTIKDYGISINDLDTVYLAGGFASYIDVDNAREIGFILNFPEDKIVKIGNSALNGATYLLLSNEARNKLVKYVKQINHLELETKTEFFDYFVEGCQFKKMNL
ncbi:MAG: ferredoxin [Chloroflexi bacterium]|nr:ferredoxin [Chloroflexota bacterium]|tara:strand:+ start:1770 stop:3404 length:1635 start_codon:yes stop_codon:yes gene_type:complete